MRIPEPLDTTPLMPLIGDIDLEGLSAIVAEEGGTVRVVEIDGQPQMMTMDFRPNRVNVAIRRADQIVIGIVGVG